MRLIGPVGHVGLVAQVGGDDDGIGAHFVGRAGCDQSPKVKDHHLITHPHNEVHVVLDDQHRHAPILGEATDDRS